MIILFMKAEQNNVMRKGEIIQVGFCKLDTNLEISEKTGFFFFLLKIDFLIHPDHTFPSFHSFQLSTISPLLQLHSPPFPFRKEQSSKRQQPGMTKHD
jgi:hypothetical protein